MGSNFFTETLFPHEFHSLQDRSGSENDPLLLEVYYGVLLNSCLSKDPENKLCIDKQMIAQKLKISMQTLLHALHQLRLKGYLELIRVHLTLYKEPPKIQAMYEAAYEGMIEKMTLHYRRKLGLPYFPWK